jgi:hypothetical protein
LDSFTPLREEEHHLLDRVKANFLELMEDPPMLENTVKMVVLAPLLDLASFYHKLFRSETETAIALEMKDEGAIIRGRIDVLVIKNQLWLLVIELSTGQKFNGVEESLGIEMKVKDEVTQEIKATTKNAFR